MQTHTEILNNISIQHNNLTFSVTLLNNKFFNLSRKSQLHSIITNDRGSPDYLAINIYYDTLRSWYTPNKLKNSDGKILETSKLKTKGIYLSYKKLAKAHGCSLETIRRKLVKLEKLGLIQRSYQHKETVTTKSYNQLIVYVWKQTPYFYNKHGIEQSKIPKLKPQTNHEYIAKKYNIDYHSQTEKIKAITKDGGIHKEVDTKELIEPFNKLKDRSRTNFVKNSFDSFSDEESSIVEPKNNPIDNSKTKKEEIRTSFTTQKTDSSYSNTELSTTQNTNGFLGSGKHLNEMLEYITDDVCNTLRASSGRRFTDRAIKEITKAVSRSKKGAKAFFYHINGFIAYLSKILRFEKRDPVKISSINYCIAANLTEEERTIQKQEKYLSEIEYSQQVSPEWHLKKKLAAVLRRDIAYKILSNYRRSERKGHIFKIYLTEQVAIGEMDKQIILNQVKAMQERAGKNGDIESIDKVEFIFQEKHAQITEKGESEKLAEITTKEEIRKLPIWLQIRKYFMDSSFKIRDGIGIDKCWLSKLNACEDNNKISDNIKTLTLKTESKFIRDWINSHYLFKLESIAKDLGYKLFLVEE
jgi:DNA-binding transcriptional regulator YhcF (GntR family)